MHNLGASNFHLARRGRVLPALRSPRCPRRYFIPSQARHLNNRRSRRCLRGPSEGLSEEPAARDPLHLPGRERRVWLESHLQLPGPGPRRGALPEPRSARRNLGVYRRLYSAQPTDLQGKAYVESDFPPRRNHRLRHYPRTPAVRCGKEQHTHDERTDRRGNLVQCQVLKHLCNLCEYIETRRSAD